MLCDHDENVRPQDENTDRFGDLRQQPTDREDQAAAGNGEPAPAGCVDRDLVKPCQQTPTQPSAHHTPSQSPARNLPPPMVNADSPKPQQQKERNPVPHRR